MHHGKLVKEYPDLGFISGTGGMAERIRSYDWKHHPLGLPQHWPQSLKIVIRIMLTSRYAMWMGWGEEFYFFCNDAYLPTVGLKRDWVLGASARQVWAEIWPDIGPRAESVVRTGNATWDEGLLLFLERSGYPEETYHTFSYSPVPDDDNTIGGMLCVVTEDTERVIGQRRLATLRDLAAELDTTRTEGELFAAVGRLLSKHPKDMPFGLIYLFDAEMGAARLVCSHPAEAGSPMAPSEIAVGDSAAVWPVAQVAANSGSVLVDGVEGRCKNLPGAVWDRPSKQAVVVPLVQRGQEHPAGFLVAGLNPYRPFDTAYRGFVDVLAGQVAAALSNVRAYEEERRRAEALAALDRAKTAFFSNISHEFRTPLTLMLGPIEEELRGSTGPRENLQIAYRSSLRLLKLVNTLLDFSRIEAGRVQASYQPTDLAAYTAELASVFRSAIEKAGLRLVVDCPPLPESIFVDQDMWEKITLNLVSNAFKFTFEGEIKVSLRWRGEWVELAVSDTGVGIPEAELPKIFERFHRVRGTRSRTFEGTGIGLALVQELARLHGGAVTVNSAENRGSTFTVSLRTGKSHLPADHISSGGRPTSASRAANCFLDEALRWFPEAETRFEARLSGEVAPSGFPVRPAVRGSARLLLADDNADMRDYLGRLLAQDYQVQAVADGQAALAAIQACPPDLVLTDLMMPGLDGFGLLQRVRADERTRSLPFILLSARAGEEARVEGLDAGADDYLTKPFSARELLARVRSQLEMARLRREAEQAARLNQERLEKIVARRTAKLQETVSELEHFSYAITHDMRGPLRAMQSFASLLEEEFAGNQSPLSRQYCQRIKTAANRLDQLITDSLDYSKAVRQDLTLEPVDLGGLLNGLVETYPNLQPDKAGIEVGAHLPTVLGNPAALTQCFSNLLGNAVKFAKTGTKPQIRVWAEKGSPGLASARGSDQPSFDPPLAASLDFQADNDPAMAQAPLVRIWVEDNGIGIPQHSLERIFGMFQRASKGYEGTGIGLAIVRKVVHRMGGEVGVESQEGLGSRFWVDLRLAAPPISAPSD
jgi:signal transduction histidine kinase